MKTTHTLSEKELNNLVVNYMESKGVVVNGGVTVTIRRPRKASKKAATVEVVVDTDLPKLGEEVEAPVAETKEAVVNEAKEEAVVETAESEAVEESDDLDDL